MFHVGIVLGLLTTLAVVLRLVARWRSKARFGADDCIIIVSLVPFYGMAVESYLCLSPYVLRGRSFKLTSTVVSIGHLGTPIYTMTPSQVSNVLKVYRLQPTLYWHFEATDCLSDIDVHNRDLLLVHNNGQDIHPDALPPNL